MPPRLHPVVYFTAGLLFLSILKLGAPVWLHQVPVPVFGGRWIAPYQTVFDHGGGKAIAVLWCVSAALIALFADDDESYRSAVWGWGAIGVLTGVMVIGHSVVAGFASLLG